MTKLASYYIPGIHVEDYSCTVPLDWNGNQPGQGFQGDAINLFYRVLCSPERVNQDLPLLLFLQGGPGGAGPRPLDPHSDGWIAEALKHFRIVLPDQRGTGRSQQVDAQSVSEFEDPRAAALFLKRFLADSIVRDFEHLRRTVFNNRKWVTLGQSYGGFLTLSYLSYFPEGINAAFTTGGIPHIPADASEVYRHTFPRMKAKTEQYYARYPQDVERVAKVADILSSQQVKMDNGDLLTVERLQSLGSDFGMKPSFERMHWLFDTAFNDADGSVRAQCEWKPRLNREFISSVMMKTSTKALYWPLQEFIYADGDIEPLRWAAQRVRDSMPEFGTGNRPLLFTGESIFPWMFEQERQLRPFRGAVELLMEEGHWNRIYDAERLAQNSVPLQAAVYYDDMYVDSGMQLDTLSRVGNAHAWVTNSFEHDGVHGDEVFRELVKQALNRGDLEQLFAHTDAQC
jgi:proline iminopeptidase